MRISGDKAMAWIATVFLLGCMASPASDAGDGDDASGALPVWVHWSGATSGITTPQALRVTAESEWREMWLRHLGVEPGRYDALHNEPALPTVDFQSSMVVALFGGEMDSVRGLKLLSATRSQDGLVLRYRVEHYNNIRPAPVTPYGIFVVPRSEARLVVQEAGPNQQDGRPSWRSIRTFAPIPERSDEGLAGDGYRTYVAFVQAVRAGTEKDDSRIPAVFWSDRVRALNPTKVYTHRFNLVVVQSDEGGIEAGKYICLPVSSYLPRNGEDGFEFTPDPDGGSSYALAGRVLDFRRIRR